MNKEFFEYLGSRDSLGGYSRSYKLVFYKCFFSLMDEHGCAFAASVTELFKAFYSERQDQGLITDLDVDERIKNIKKSSLADVYAVILANPFKHISEKGFVLKRKAENGKEQFYLPAQLVQELTQDELTKINQIVDDKLKLYYQKIDAVPQNDSISLKSAFERMLSEYVPATEETFAGHPLGSFFRNELPQSLYKTGIVNSDKYLVTGSVGQGNWATIPWLCIFDKSITTSATKGVCIVYLLSKDGSTLYLTFNQGCTEIRRSNTKKNTISIMREKAAEIVGYIDSKGFLTDEDIDLGNNISELGELYQKGTIFYKAYKKSDVPSEKELRTDLSNMMAIYSEYATGKKQNENSWLISWNPDSWVWDDYATAIDETSKGKRYNLSWSCVSTKVAIGDRVFLTVLGQKDKNGIIASGYATSLSHEEESWDDEKRVSGKKSRYIDVSFDRIYDFNGDVKLAQDYLQNSFPLQQWSPQGSGITIKEEYREELESAWAALSNGGEESVSTKDILNGINNYIAEKGFSYEQGLIENFYLSLKTKPFVILAGTSGTGKTRLVKLFAEAVGAITDNGRYKLVAVRPDWSDSSDLFGHVDLSGNFVPGAIIDFVKKAELDADKPYFLCLDEMNLARVEYYLSDILSIIETRDRLANGSIVSDPLVSETYFGTDTAAMGKYGKVLLPENLYIIGTVNMDETTFPFSRKVLDRANTIEFSFVDLMPGNAVHTKVQSAQLSNSFLKTEYLLLAECNQDGTYVQEVCSELQEINRVLQTANAHIGYRVRDEITFYMLNNKSTALLSRDEAMDNELMQKILPRIQGSSNFIKQMLCELFKICAGDYEGYQTETDDVSAKMLKAAKLPTCKYKHSAEKISFMVRRFEEDGFTSYWL